MLEKSNPANINSPIETSRPPKSEVITSQLDPQVLESKLNQLKASQLNNPLFREAVEMLAEYNHRKTNIAFELDVNIQNRLQKKLDGTTYLTDVNKILSELERNTNKTNKKTGWWDPHFRAGQTNKQPDDSKPDNLQAEPPQSMAGYGYQPAQFGVAIDSTAKLPNPILKKELTTPEPLELTPTQRVSVSTITKPEKLPTTEILHNLDLAKKAIQQLLLKQLQLKKIAQKGLAKNAKEFPAFIEGNKHELGIAYEKYYNLLQQARASTGVKDYSESSPENDHKPDRSKRLKKLLLASIFSVGGALAVANPKNTNLIEAGSLPVNIETTNNQTDTQTPSFTPDVADQPVSPVISQRQEDVRLIPVLEPDNSQRSDLPTVLSRQTIPINNDQPVQLQSSVPSFPSSATIGYEAIQPPVSRWGVEGPDLDLPSQSDSNSELETNSELLVTVRINSTVSQALEQAYLDGQFTGVLANSITSREFMNRYWQFDQIINQHPELVKNILGIDSANTNIIPAGTSFDASAIIKFINGEITIDDIRKNYNLNSVNTDSSWPTALVSSENTSSVDTDDDDQIIKKVIPTTPSSVATEENINVPSFTPEAVAIYKSNYPAGQEAWERDFSTYVNTYIPNQQTGWMSSWFNNGENNQTGLYEHLVETNMTLNQFESLNNGKIADLHRYLRQHHISITDFRALQEMINEITSVKDIQTNVDMTLIAIMEAGFVQRRTTLIQN